MIHLVQPTLGRRNRPSVNSADIHDLVSGHLAAARRLDRVAEEHRVQWTLATRNDATRQAASEARRRDAFSDELQRIAKGELDSYTEEHEQ